MLAGAALAASVPPVGVAPLVFLGPWPLLAAVRDRGPAARLALGAVAGLVWAAGTVFYWLYPAVRSHLASTSLAAALLAAAGGWVYGGLYLCALALVYPWLPTPRWLTAPALWVLFEALLSQVLGGNPWARLGHATHGLLPLAQLAELTGVAGLSFLALMPAAALAERGAARRRGLVVWAGTVAAATAFGVFRLATLDGGPDAPGGEPIVVVSGHNLAPDPLAAYRAASASAPPATLTVWPESAFPGYPADEPAAAAAVVETARARGWLLLGARRHHGAGAARRYENAAVLVDPAGRWHEGYAKSRLVPFAERSPWPFPELVARPYSPGPARPAPLTAGPLRVGVLVCWESLFADPARGYARDGVDVLVNLTSDRDLGAGALQMLAFSRFRAIETRRWLVRASGTGPTHLIDPAGRLHLATTLRVPRTTAPPGLYVRTGDFFPWLAAAVLAAAILARRRERRDAPQHER